MTLVTGVCLFLRSLYCQHLRGLRSYSPERHLLTAIRSTLMSVQSTTRQNSLDSTSTRTSPDSSRYNSSTNTRPSNTRQSSHSHSRSLGSRTPQRSQSHPQTVAQPPVRPNVLTKNLSMTGSKSQPQSPAGYVSVAHPGSGQQPLIRINRTGSAHGHTGYDPYTNTRYVAYGH
jgi:hypothetical protein